MKKTILIDDEPLARMIIGEYLQSHPQIAVVQECGDGFEGVKAIQHHRPDLIFLDIQMPKINGFEMLELIEQPPSVIFTTMRSCCAGDWAAVSSKAAVLLAACGDGCCSSQR